MTETIQIAIQLATNIAMTALTIIAILACTLAPIAMEHAEGIDQQA